jgi:multidrug transporter EmrE-like cation transporter
MRDHLLLAAAVFFEVLWAVALKLSRGFTVGWASAATLSAYVLSLVFLSLACARLPISVAYAVWTGSGATLVAIIGVLAFHEPINPGRACGFLLVIAGVVLLLGLEGAT